MALVKIFCDLDGVLVDFDDGVLRCAGVPPDALSPTEMWNVIGKSKGFWESLPWTSDGRLLWSFLKRHAPNILSGLPATEKMQAQAVKGKKAWCKEHLGKEVKVITCMKHQKSEYCAAGDILIDDSDSARSKWELAGGIFVHHTNSESTVAAVKAILRDFANGGQPLTKNTYVGTASTSTSGAPLDCVQPQLAAIFLTEESRAKLHEHFPAQHAVVHSDHCTLQVRPSSSLCRSLLVGSTCTFQVYGCVVDEKAQALVVQLPQQLRDLCANAVPHVTISTNHSTAPVYSNQLLRNHGAERLLSEAPVLELEGVVGVSVSPLAREKSVVEKDVYPDEFVGVVGLAPFLRDGLPGQQLEIKESDVTVNEWEAAEHCADLYRLTKTYVGSAKKQNRSLVLKMTKQTLPRRNKQVANTGGTVVRDFKLWSSLSLVFPESEEPTTRATTQTWDAVEPSVAINSPLRTVRKLAGGECTLQQLVHKYHLVLKTHPVHRQLVQLSYSQLESQMASPVVQECRGLLLERESWRVVALPFTKFFNHGETYAAGIDWTTATVYEKLDGSLCTLYHYAGQWHIATSKLPDAGGRLPRSDQTFVELFWETWKCNGYQLPLETHCCFMFELITPSNRLVVRYTEARLVSLAARDLESLEEVPVEPIAAKYGWQMPRRYDDLRSLAAVEAAARQLNPMDNEGFVVVDAAWRRLKVKSPQYVALHRMMDNGGCGIITGGNEGSDRVRKRRMLEIARANEGSEFLAYFPELGPELRKAHLQLNCLSQLLEGGLLSGTSAEVAAEALAARAHKEQCSLAALLAEIHIRDLEELLQAAKDRTETLPPEHRAQLEEMQRRMEQTGEMREVSTLSAPTIAPFKENISDTMTEISLEIAGNRPLMLVLVGLPGSGKSTFCKKLKRAMGDLPGQHARNELRVVCQDELGSRQQCQRSAEKALEAGRSVAIDRTNFNPEQRKEWMKLGRQYSCMNVALLLQLPEEECLARVMARKGHKTLPANKSAAGVVQRVAKDLISPTGKEEFDVILEVATGDDSQRFITMIITWLAKQILPDQESESCQQGVACVVDEETDSDRETQVRTINRFTLLDGE